MPGSAPFRLNRHGMLLALVSAAFAGEAAARLQPVMGEQIAQQIRAFVELKCVAEQNEGAEVEIVICGRIVEIE